MPQDLAAFLLSAAGLAALVGVGEALRTSGRATAEVSRGVVHVGVGVFVALTPFFFREPTWIYGLAAAFVLLNGVAAGRGWLKGMHGIRRRSAGTVTFPLALIVALWVAWTVDAERVFALQIAFLILAISDPLAALVGTRVQRPGRYRVGGGEKSVAGTLAFGMSAFVLTAGALWAFRTSGTLGWSLGEIGFAALVVAVVTGAVEALGGRGWDNFFIVLAAIVVLVYFEEHPAARPWLGIAVGAGVIFGVAAFRLQFLDPSGAVAGGLLAASLVGVGGWRWAVPSLTFFVLSSLLSKAARSWKASARALEEKTDVRDAGQVYANGGVGWGLLLLHAVYPSEVLYWSFLGAFAAAAADTWATELGTLSGRPPRLLFSMRRVPAGTSGAVSGLGTASAFLGAAVVVGSGWVVLGMEDALYLGMPWLGAGVVLGGFLGALADSIAGATFQAQYRDAQTGQATERATSLHEPNLLVRGRRWIDNDRVNLFCTLTGAVAAMAWALGTGLL
ncbi:MAG: DUF92 domain-containing protein [Rhodothermales bacterium]